MALVPKEERDTVRRVGNETLADKVRKLEKKQLLLERQDETAEGRKDYKWAFRWRFKFNQSKRKRYRDLVLVIFLNKKGEIESPKFMPIFDGNMVVWKNKPYEFDPRAVWTLQTKGRPRVYLIKEIDRRPVRNKYGDIVFRDASVSNQDLDEIRARGDSTESDEFLIKAAIKAQQAQGRKKINIAVLVVLGIIIVGALIWFFRGG